MLDRQVGRGGMAVVYLAEDQRYHRRVAVKVLRPELAASLAVDRFLREIQTAARLQHPNILPGPPSPGLQLARVESVIAPAEDGAVEQVTQQAPRNQFRITAGEQATSDQRHEDNLGD